MPYASQMARKPAQNDGRNGIWTHAELARMNNNALAKMAQHHPNRAPPEIKLLLLQIKKSREGPDYSPEAAERVLAELFASLPENDGIEEMVPEEIDRMQIETAKAIREAIAKQHGITISDLDSVSHNRRLVLPRHTAIYIIVRECPQLSLPRIGKMFGGRDHTTIIHSVHSHATLHNLPLPRGMQPRGPKVRRKQITYSGDAISETRLV